MPAIHGRVGSSRHALIAALASASALAQLDENPATRRPRGVVILNLSDPTLPAFVVVDNALRATLTAPGGLPVDTFAENLDAMRFLGTQLEAEVLTLLAKKYAELPIDAVVAIGPPALDFAERHRSRLWPQARIVFNEVPAELLRDRQLSPTTTGIALRHDLAGTVDLALTLRPATRRLVVVARSGDYDRMMTGVAKSQLTPYAVRLTIEYWTGSRIDELLRRVAQLSSDDAVLYLSFARDAAGRTFVPREVLKQLSDVSPVPIYGPFETFIGHGVVAGMSYDFETSGRRAGELVREVLSARMAGSPPVVELGTSCLADGDALERFGMSAGRLPRGCEVRFARPSLWREYRWYILGALGVLLAQSALIIALVLQRRGRRMAEDEARHRRSELAQASRLALAGELTASITHEINQPLGAILANAGAAEAMLRRGVTKDEELCAILADIRLSDLRASEIIRRVRALVTAKQVECEPVDVNAMMDEVLALLQGEARRRNVAIDISLAPGLPAPPADRVLLQQAVVDLCLNAMDAMDAMADVDVSKRRLGVRTTALANGGVEIAVSDTGPGIAPEQLPKLFDSFFTTKPHGMGLGLSITRSIVEAHEGTVSAENRDGGGALFRIVLPANHARLPEYGQVPASAAKTSSRRATHDGLSRGSR
jgi:signal transduction histidine kinase